MLVWLAAVGTAATAPPAVGVETGWPAFRSEAGRFSVRLPSAPEESASTRMTLGGRIASAEYRVEMEGSELRVEHHEVPSLARVFLSDAALLRRAERDFLADENATQVSVASSSVQGHPARSVSYRAGDVAGRALFVLVRSRLYVLATLQPLAAPRDTLDPFFHSFHVWD